jgi:hypothetical protein
MTTKTKIGGQAANCTFHNRKRHSLHVSGFRRWNFQSSRSKLEEPVRYKLIQHDRAHFGPVFLLLEYAEQLDADIVSPSHYRSSKKQLRTRPVIELPACFHVQEYRFNISPLQLGLHYEFRQECRRLERLTSQVESS